jgi:hypothetical protein
VETKEPRAEQVDLGSLPLDRLAQRGVLGGEWPAAGEAGEPAIVREGDLAGDEEQRAEHRGSIPASVGAGDPQPPAMITLDVNRPTG